MPMNPLIPSIFTDFLFILSPRLQQKSTDSFCAKVESKFLDCLDAYGTLRVREKCAELLYDISECNNHIAQYQRAKIMKKERMKQYREGKLAKPFEEYPPLDSYLSI